MALSSRTYYPIVPLRVLGLSFLLSWLWVLLFYHPVLSINEQDVFSLAIGLIIALGVIALRQKHTVRRYLVTSTQFFISALMMTAITFVLLSIEISGTLPEAFPLEVILWALLGYALVNPFIQWIRLYVQWDIDTASFFIIWSFVLSAIECGILFVLVSPAFIVAISFFPLSSFILFKICHISDDSSIGNDGLGYRKILSVAKPQFLILLSYAFVIGTIYAFNFTDFFAVGGWFLIAGIALASLTTAIVLWLHYSRRKGLRVQERLFVFCMTIGLALLPFIAKEYRGLLVSLLIAGTVFIVMLGAIFLIDIIRNLRLPILKTCIITIGLITCSAIGGFFLGHIIRLFAPAGQTSVIVVHLVLIMAILITAGMLSFNKADWIAETKSAFSESVITPIAEPKGLELFPDIKHSVSTAYFPSFQESENGRNTDNQDSSSYKEKCIGISTQYDLSPREFEVFLHLAKGRNARWIAKQLQISLHTVKSHINHIYEKLDVHSVQELIDLVEIP